MESFFSRYKNALVLILVLFLQVIGVAMQVRRPLPREHAQPDAGGVRLIRYWAISLVSPPERLVHWIGSSILGVWDNYIDLIHIRQQNKDLEAQLQRLKLEQGSVVEDAWQGQRLQKLLDFKEHYIYQTVPAQVIGNSGTEQSHVLHLDKGAKDGVAVDMPVITADGIVGRVREVFPHTSQVLEISDPTSGAGVILSTTRIRGILRGNAMGQPQVVSVMPDDRIKSGEAVVTSGGDQIFPRGLAVGYVDKVVADPERDPLVDILIRPAANLSRLEEVLIITNMGDQVTPRERLDMLQSQALASAQQLKASEILAEKLPSRVDPDAPKSEDENTDNADAADGGAARPLRPLPALRPDRFSPNTTPSAASLVPGARLAAQAEGVISHPSPKPHPPAASGSESSPATAQGAATVPPVRKATPSADGSSATAVSRPSTATASPDGTGTVVRHAATVPGSDASTQPRPTTVIRPPVVDANGNIVHRPAVTAPATDANGLPIHRPSAIPTATVPATDANGLPVHKPANPATPSTRPATNAANASQTPGQSPKTNVIVDGPLSSAMKKTTPATPVTPHSSATQPSQHPSAPAQHPAGQASPSTSTQPRTSTTGTQPRPAAPGGTPRPAATPAATQRPAQPVQHKGPELVPDDGSRPPPSMLQQNRPKPAQPQPNAGAAQPPQRGAA